MEDQTRSLSEVAGLMGVSERTVRRWIKAGRLKAYKPGRDYRIPEAGLRAFIEESEISPKDQAPLQLELEESRGADEERRIPTAEEMDEVTAALVRQVKYRLKIINRWREIGVGALEEAACGWFDMDMANDQIFRELQKHGSDEVINNRQNACTEDLKAALRQTDAFGGLLGTAADARTVVRELSEQATKEGTRIVEALEDLLMAARDKRDS